MLLTLRQASERLNTSISGVYALVAQGLLPVVATGAGGKGYRVSDDDLNAFIDSRRKGKRPEPWPEKTNPYKFKHLRKEDSQWTLAKELKSSRQS